MGQDQRLPDRHLPHSTGSVQGTTGLLQDQILETQKILNSVANLDDFCDKIIYE